MFWVLWKTRNRACFEQVIPSDHYGIIYPICQLADEWADLQKPKVVEPLRRGTDLMKLVTQDIFNKMKGWSPLCQRIDNG